ncbi:MAG: tRNA pseudouridine(55) synthase TruB [Candidatus Zixiibacteriota bacterium]
MRSREYHYNGVLLYNKPSGISSHDAVLDIRRTINQRRVGHTGTLDPLAEGLLVICLGQATKIAQFLSDLDKTYEAEIRLGQDSVTYDSEGITENQTAVVVPELGEYEITELLAEYKGRIRQKVPAYSAVKVGGQRLYNLARSGVRIEPVVREIEIKQIEPLGYSKPRLHLLIRCSRGTYIRSLAHDLGEKIGCGGYLSQLRRTSVGKFNLSSALTLTDVKRYHENGTLDKYLLGYDDVLHYSAIIVTDEFKRQVISGKALRPKEVVGLKGDFSAGERVLLMDKDEHVLAVGRAEVPSNTFDQEQTKKLFSYIRVLI